MNRFTRWLTTVPREDELFFMNLRKTASDLFDWMHYAQKLGHSWKSNGELIRKCPKCGREQWKMVKRIPPPAEWYTIYPSKDMP